MRGQILDLCLCHFPLNIANVVLVIDLLLFDCFLMLPLQFFIEYNSKLLESSNYITRRQAVKVKNVIFMWLPSNVRFAGHMISALMCNLICGRRFFSFPRFHLQMILWTLIEPVEINCKIQLIPKFSNSCYSEVVAAVF